MKVSSSPARTASLPAWCLLLSLLAAGAAETNRVRILEWDYPDPIDAPATFYIYSATGAPTNFVCLTNIPITRDVTCSNSTFSFPISISPTQNTFLYVTLSNIWAESPQSNITNAPRILTGTITNHIR